MPLTVADVLALPVLSAGAPLVRAGGDALTTPVRWVHVSEQTEVAGTLRGGELVLSTGMGLTEGRFDAPAYVRSLRGAGAVALVVELGPHLPVLPERLVRAAAAEGLPLVELGRVVRFVAVTEEVHARILHEQYDRLAFSEQVHETFSSLAAGGGTVEEVLDRAASLLGAAVVLEDLGHHAVALAGAARPQDVLQDWTHRSRRAPAGGTGPEHWPDAPVGPVGRRWGRLVLPERVADPSAAALVLRRAAETLTVVRLLDPAGGEEPALAAHDALLRDLLRGRPSDEAALRARARALGLSTRGGGFAPLVVACSAADGPAVLEAARRALGATRATGLVGRLRSDLVGVLLAGAPDRLDAAVTALAHAVATPVGGPRTPAVAIASAGVAPGFAALAEGFAEAVHVAEVAAALPDRDPRHVHRLGDLGARGLLWWLRTDPRLQAFVEVQLAPLLAGGPDDRSLDLLRDFLDEAGSMTRLARRLHLSRPATYGRVDRLRERLGVDLDAPETRLTLHLALLAHDQAERGR